jgi:hypothetical protein
VIALKLPPGDRRKVFEKKDFITFFLLARDGPALRRALWAALTGGLKRRGSAGRWRYRWC